VTFRNMPASYAEDMFAPPPNLQAGGPPLVHCSRLFIQHIQSCPTYLEAVSSIRSLRTRHAVLTLNHFTLITGRFLSSKNSVEHIN